MVNGVRMFLLTTTMTASCLLAVTLATASAQPAGASPRYWFLQRLSATDLQASDWKLLRQNVQLALYELQDGRSVAWTDPDTEHSGSIRMLGTQVGSDRTCRQLRVSVDVDAGSDDAVYQLCKTELGFWSFPSSRGAGARGAGGSD